MREEPIDITSDADSLQYAVLKTREELIECKAAKEYNEAEMRDEIAALSQLHEEKAAKEQRENEMMAKLNEAHTSLGIANSQVGN
ncbi:hypothetical protein PMAYCL1PPCAC_13481, partial [Pristionchus mayeri]